jgi:DNA gyrase inhibitor GyrI
MGFALKYFVLPFSAAALVVAGYVLIHLGAFRSVEVHVVERGPYTLIYRDHAGAYYQINGVISEVEKWVRAQGQPCDPSFGEYLDDPNTTEEARLHSRGGCVVEKVPSDLPADFHVRVLPLRQYLMATFSGSPAIGPVKVYPKIESMRRERKLQTDGPIIEMYHILDESRMETTYLLPVKF